MARFSTRSFAATALAAAMFAAAAVPAMAQTAPAPAAPVASADAKPAPRHHERGPRMTPEQRQERMAKHAEAFKQKLKITADQEPAWNAFQEAMHPKNRPDHARLDRKDMDKLTTPERIDRMRALHAQRSAEMDRRGEAVKTFYAALKPEQQKTFDQESARMMHRFGPGDHKGERDGKRGPRGEHGHRHHGKQAPADAAAPAAPVQPQ
ncbi:Spy/CpxP family protein refolding chaperone [Diaphorobacter ruginosibacter]|uniref:Spy/CpxP family protein refolding chaperone n=1 Tax=Diaphorobacter ruginosibacter TaxID=1715720 RepID=A0A7G9RMK9_9BURK|nr:Spy/CpxP family protein refolding chaperone [Diaphorobacter ruginosibacter]QNN56834.1 Spy/CpxP family protein refolding chaperone [Diaphorobacter ruginosibacter]